jgi:hypothetical protein
MKKKNIKSYAYGGTNLIYHTSGHAILSSGSGAGADVTLPNKRTQTPELLANFLRGKSTC